VIDMVSVHDVAAYILSKLRGGMSTMKLQKLVYYSQAWHLVWAEEPLFPERIEAWANGPVAPTLFAAHRGRFSVSDWPKGDATKLDKSQTGTIDAVIETYGHLDGRQLSYLTHEESPWKDAREGLGPTETSHVEIARDAMQQYYSSVDQAEEAVPVDELNWGEWLGEIVDDDPQHWM
jgi:uncharacterized phage-associated protein